MKTNPIDELSERIFHATLGALELYSIHLGWRLGLYRALDGQSLTSGELAATAGIDERYAREWLEQQAVASLVEVDDPASEPATRRFSLSDAQRAVLLDATDPAHVAPFAPMVAGIGAALPRVVDAYRIGAGVPYATYGRDFRDGQGGINRPAYTHDLATWMKHVPVLDEPGRLRVADLACGQGWSTIALAAALPHADVVGIDSDESSVLDARAHAAAARQPNLSFETADASSLAGTGRYDLVCIFEALHDLAQPVAVLAAGRAALSDNGAMLVVDEKVCDHFTAPGDEVERMMYGWSVTHCLPASRADVPSAALGTALRTATVNELALDAGFASCEVLPIDHDFFRFYLLEL